MPMDISVCKCFRMAAAEALAAVSHSLSGSALREQHIQKHLFQMEPNAAGGFVVLCVLSFSHDMLSARQPVHQSVSAAAQTTSLHYSKLLNFCWV